jgi:hypothetical protein
MSTPEQPATPPLTRRQLREIRNTGSTPVIAPDTAEGTAGESPAPTPPAPLVQAVPEPTPSPSPAPLARAAEPVEVPPAPVADSAVDLGASPLTRRQARQQERIRTASVPVITPEVAAAYSSAASGRIAPVTELPPISGDVPANGGMHDLFSLATAPAPIISDASGASVRPVPSGITEAPTLASWQPATSENAPEAEGDGEADADAELSQRERVVSPLLGADLLDAEIAEAELPPSFDQLLARSTGAVSMPNALILSQAPDASPMVAPLSSTGEVLITGSFNLPEGLGSTGHALGTADGKEVDATLVDGELPAHSSPTPIAASAAISTVKSAGDVIRPPAPEKGSRLMLTLAITAGALALALVGVLILAFTTGVL